jgi:hypothetical protein
MALFRSARLPRRRRGFVSRPGHVSPVTSSLGWSRYFLSSFMERNKKYGKINVIFKNYGFIIQSPKFGSGP